MHRSSRDAVGMLYRLANVGVASAALRVALMVVLPSSPLQAEEAAATAQIALGIAPTGASVAIDGVSLTLTNGGSRAEAWVAPGSHDLAVEREGYSPLERIIRVPADGLRGSVRLERSLPKVTVYMAGGGETTGGLVSRDADSLVLKRGRSKVTLTPGQYEKIEITGEQVPGDSVLLLAGPRSKATVAKRDAEPKLPPGFERAFMVPDAARDQHGNRVVERRRQTCDPNTGWPYEIWLKEPRMEFLLIDAGEFMMGSALSAAETAKRFGDSARDCMHEHPQHAVRITRPFYLGKYEVLNAQYRAYKPDHDSGSGAELTESLNGDTQPAVHLWWYGADRFCSWLAQAAGVPARLPTEAEWEYACRAGSRTPFFWGRTARRAARYANLSGSADGFTVTAPVGKFGPNALGLYDMIGNAWEFCSDGYDPRYYEHSPKDDPPGASTYRSRYRIIRGESYRGTAGRGRCAVRRGQHTRRWSSSYGFRCAVSMPEP